MSGKSIENTVSVIIPCYNVEDYIEDCLSSVFNQDYNKVEVIAVDNNSSDNTLELLRKFKKRNKQSLKILEEKRKGAPYARNKGLKMASGVWIQFLDADDLLLPGKIKHQIELADYKGELVDFISGAYTRRNKEGVNSNIVYVADNEPIIACYSKSLGITSSNLWRRDSILEIGGWKEGLKSGQEADLMFRLLQNDAKVLIDNKPLTIIRQRKSGQISDGSIGNKLRYIKLRLSILAFIKEFKPSLLNTNSQLLYQHLYNRIRSLSRIDVNKAASFYYHIPKSFMPSGPFHFKLYKKCLDVFGFIRIERLRKRLTVKVGLK